MTTIEEKAKAYDKVIEKLRDFYRDYDTVSCLIDVKEELANLFPELKESKDERIRKVLVGFFKSYKEQGTCWAETFNEIPTDNILAWLEKQKKLTNAEFEQGKTDVLWCIKQAKKSAKDENDMGNVWYAERWLKSLKDRFGCEVNCTTTKAWSEEDKGFLDSALWHIQNSITNGNIKAFVECPLSTWLKSIKDRIQPQNAWKPSDDQMREFGVVATGKGLFSKEILRGLLEQLKKLREE